MLKKVVLLICFISLYCCKTKTIVQQPIADKIEEINYIPYYLKVYEADSLYIVKDYQKSYEILDSLFQKYEPVNMSIYYELRTYYESKILLGKKIDLKDFSKLITKYGYTLERIKNDSLTNIYYEKEKVFFDNNYDRLRAEHISSLNIDLRNKIKIMNNEDQLYRKPNYNQEKQDKLDSINSSKLKIIFDSYGYPSENVIGNYSTDNNIVGIETILLHTKDKERLSYFMPKVFEYVLKGKSSPLTYARMKDQYNLYNGQEQYYGSYENKTTIDVKELNRRRKIIGLPNYGYEKRRYQKLYPEEYKKIQEVMKKEK